MIGDAEDALAAWPRWTLSRLAVRITRDRRPRRRRDTPLGPFDRARRSIACDARRGKTTVSARPDSRDTIDPSVPPGATRCGRRLKRRGSGRRHATHEIIVDQAHTTCAPVAQGIEHRFPKPCAKVRILPGAQLKSLVCLDAAAPARRLHASRTRTIGRDMPFADVNGQRCVT